MEVETPRDAVIAGIDRDAAITETLIQSATDIAIHGSTSGSIGDEAEKFLVSWYRRKMPPLEGVPDLK